MSDNLHPTAQSALGYHPFDECPHCEHQAVDHCWSVFGGYTECEIDGCDCDDFEAPVEADGQA